MSGWVKLHRGLLDNWLNSDPEHLAAWARILLLVNWKPGKAVIKGKVLMVEPGQSVMSYQSWAKALGWSKSRVVRFFKTLEKAECIRLENETVTVRLSVVNWALYQDDRNGSGTEAVRTPERKRNGSGTEAESIEEGKKGSMVEEDIPPVAPHGALDPQSPDDLSGSQQGQLDLLHEAMDNVESDASTETGLEGFDEAWDRYAYKTGKKAAQRAWKRLSMADRRAAWTAMPAYLSRTDPAGLGGKTIRAHMSSWINGRRWEDEEQEQQPEAPTKKTVADLVILHPQVFVGRGEEPQWNALLAEYGWDMVAEVCRRLRSDDSPTYFRAVNQYLYDNTYDDEEDSSCRSS